MTLPWQTITLYALVVLGIHLGIIWGIRRLRAWMGRVILSDSFGKRLFSSLRFKIYVLWGLVAIVISATYLEFSALAHITRALSSFLLCLILCDVCLLVCLVFLGKFIKNREDVYPLLRKFLAFFFVVLGIVMAANNLGYSISGLLTTFGIGGAAIAFAAQNTLANLWATLSVLLDHPFKEGDWIVVGTRASGRVKSIGLRSTALTTEQGSEITIPNSIIVNECIENKGAKSSNKTLSS